jgi:plasmid replication initiation protein
VIRKGKYIAVRPNSLIEARYDLSSGQNDIIDMVLSKIENDNNYLYELNINDYKKLYRTDTSNIYRDLKKAVKSMEGTGFYLINKNNKGIEKETFFVWFASIDYLESEGKIVVEVGQRLKGLLVEMKKRIYYKIEYSLNFSSIYSKRIYYYLKSFEDTGWRIDNLDALRKKLHCPKSYNKYSFFKIKVLDMACKEINNYSDIKFTYEEIKTGRKVTNIRFDITNKRSKALGEISATEDKEKTEEIVMDLNVIKNIIHEDISNIEAIRILDAANGDIEKIKEKYDIISQFNKVNNVVGAMIKAIKEDWTNTGKSRVNAFTDYEQRKYDYDELEKKLLGLE